MPTLQIHDYSLNYDYHFIGKSKPTLFFIHDLGMDSTMWTSLLPYVNKTFNTLTYDFFGHGQTTDSSSLISLESLYHEIIALLDKLKLENVHFVGCRFGAIIAFRFARLYPDLMQSLTLMSIPFYVQKGSFDKEFRTLIQLLRLDRDLMEQKLILDSIYPVTHDKSKLIADAFSRVSSQNFVFLINTLVKENHDQSFDWIDSLKNLKVPMLLMHGEFDPVYPARLSVVFSTYAPNARALVIPSASCFIMLDQPALTADFLTSFIFSEKIPVPAAFSHRKIIHEFKDLVEKGYQKTPIRRRFLRMSILSGDTLVYWNGEPISGKWNQRNAKELLFFIILNHGAVKRDELIDTFMPELPINQAKNHLRVQLSHLNKIFQNHTDIGARSALMLGRDTIALYADTECDLIDYLNDMEKLLWENEPLSDQVQHFIHMLEVYHPYCLSSYHGEWVSLLIERIDSKLAQIMVMLLKKLSQSGQLLAAHEVLEAGRVVEPYDGFCDEWLDELKRIN